MSEYTIGVLGGMGPFATSVYFNRVIQKTKAFKDQDHINMVILNHASIPDRTEVIEKNDPNEFLDSIKNDMKLFNQSVEFVVIPCNTSHYFINDIKNLATVDVLNMVELTVQSIARNYPKNSRVAVLATNGTTNTGIYKKALEKNDLEYFKVNNDIQNKIMNLIYSFKQNPNIDDSVLENIIDELITHHKCDCIILACTELSCMNINDKQKDNVVDALDVLVDESIKLAIYNNKKKLKIDVKNS